MIQAEHEQLILIRLGRWKRSNQRGQSILELIVAMAIFSLIGAAMVTMAVGGFTALERGGEYTQAEALTQEGIEAVRSIRDGAWNENIYSQSAVATSSGQWVFEGEGTTEIIGQFTRTITFSDVCRDGSDEITSCPGSYTDVHTKKVTVSVSWDIRTGVTNSVQRIAYLTNWDSQEWTQTDWSGGSGQSTWSDATKYDSDDGNVNIDTFGQVEFVCGGTQDSGFDSGGGTCSGMPSACSSQGEGLCSSCGCTWNTGSCSNSGSCAGCSNNPQCNPCEPFGCSWSKGNCIGTLDCSSASDETSCIDCSQCSWNPGACSGTPSDCSTHSDEISCTNCGCTWSGGVWNFSTWDVDGGEVTPEGNLQTSGGNPDGYVDITVPRGGNDQVGGYWEQAFTTVVDNPSNVSVDFDYKVIDFNDSPDVAELRIYIDTSSGNPDTQIGNAVSISGEGSWTSDTVVDSSSAITTAGTYYLKIAFWVETPPGGPGATGPFMIGYDNVSADLGNGTCPTSGYLISSAFDMGDASPVQVIEWDETLPSGSDIKFQIRAAETQAGLSSESWSSYFNTAEGELISTDYNGNRWAQYRVELSGDGSDTPVLQEIRINYK